MNHWTEFIDIYQITYSRQGYSNVIHMKPLVKNDSTRKSHHFLLEVIAKTFKIFSLGHSYIVL